MIEKKSCPFCGSINLNVCHTAVYWIECDKCGANTGSGKTEVEAIKLWNKRL